ncbi:DUF4097 family beta strand repeat-containing protein [Winogradskyella endarachnes]|uniref:DUF4097 family beta strand repeat protein n=1 Tax=Winogradskyella endarachnes TaxID=2681965 RepID=A0A6L6U8C7_9FLAO|nr:hypothetical protein [Winogradskyella endarachnes]MUU78523.1 hypothetical protein [Winogradskyella endarachnes]
MIRKQIIKPWTINFMAFFVLFVLSITTVDAQNIIEKIVQLDDITSIAINGNDIFNISVSTSKTDKIKIASTLDGEYQNDFQIVVHEEKSTLKLSLEHVSLEEIPDDKRNAHKVIAATLHIEIPESLNVNILSDIGSVNLLGTFNVLNVELLRGQLNIKGKVKTATVNTLDGNIHVITNSATIEANSNHGEIELDEFSNTISIWRLTSIHGDIKVINS